MNYVYLYLTINLLAFVVFNLHAASQIYRGADSPEVQGMNLFAYAWYMGTNGHNRKLHRRLLAEGKETNHESMPPLFESREVPRLIIVTLLFIPIWIIMETSEWIGRVL